MYKYHGWLVAFAAHKAYLSFIVMREDIINANAAELQGYKYRGTTIHFTPEKPLPATLVTRLVKARVTENKKNDKK